MNKAAKAGGLQTEFEFTLPRGYVDETGTLHKKGKMRLATAMDEIAPLRDPRVRANQAYLVIILLARVITSSARSRSSTPASSRTCSRRTWPILQDFYRKINELSPDDAAEEDGAGE